MKIVLLASISGGGGIQNFNQELEAAARAAGAEVIAVDRSAAHSSFGFALRATLAVIRHRPDVVFCGHLYFSPLAYVFSFFGLPYVLFLHGIEAWGAQRPQHVRAVRRAAIVSVISAYTRDKAMRTLGLPAERFFFLSPPVDDAQFTFADKISGDAGQRALRARWGLGDAPIILTVARLAAAEQYKGYDTVIRALPLIRKTYPGAKYLLVGDGDDAPRVRALVTELGLEDAVVMAGRVSAAELPDCYRLAGVFAMPSTGEGFGIVFLEAVACGTPAVAGNADGSRQALLDGALGLLVDARSLDAVADGIIRSLSDDRSKLPPELRDARALRAKAVEAFGIDAFRAHVRALLHLSEKNI